MSIYSRQQTDEMPDPQDTKLIIRFSGRDADEQQLPLDDFLTSLSGWRDYLNMATSVFLQKKLTLNNPTDEEKLDIRIKEVRPGSQEVLFLITIATVSNLLASKADKLITLKNIPKLWSWVNDLFDFHVKNKKEFKTKEEIAVALEKLAQQAEIAVDETKPESQQFVSYIDNRLKDAVMPIERSATDILLESSAVNIHVDINTSRAINNSFVASPHNDDYFNATVRVRELNLDTGHTRLEVLKSDREEFISKLDGCYIVDSALNEPQNKYSQSLDKHQIIEVCVTHHIDKSTGKTQKWKIYGDTPTPPASLFDQ